MNGFISPEQQHITMQRNEDIVVGYNVCILVVNIFNVYFGCEDELYFHFMDLGKGRIFTSVNIGLECFNLLQDNWDWRNTSSVHIFFVHKGTQNITGQQRGSKTNTAKCHKTNNLSLPAHQPILLPWSKTTCSTEMVHELIYIKSSRWHLITSGHNCSNAIKSLFNKPTSEKVTLKTQTLPQSGFTPFTLMNCNCAWVKPWSTRVKLALRTRQQTKGP